MKRSLSLLSLLVAVSVSIGCAGFMRSMSPVDCTVLYVGSEEFNYAIKQFKKVKSGFWDVSLGSFIKAADRETGDKGTRKAMIAKMNYSWVHSDKNVYKLRSLWKQTRYGTVRSQKILRERMICLEVLIVVDPKTDELVETDPVVEVYDTKGNQIDRFIGNGAWQFMSHMNRNW